jgi:hypothetical protein
MRGLGTINVSIVITPRQYQKMCVNISNKFVMKSMIINVRIVIMLLHKQEDLPISSRQFTTISETRNVFIVNCDYAAAQSGDLYKHEKTVHNKMHDNK